MNEWLNGWMNGEWMDGWKVEVFNGQPGLINGLEDRNKHNGWMNTMDRWINKMDGQMIGDWNTFYKWTELEDVDN